ncbi:19247_t:CDS:2, partial [Racocetra fulgida]
MRSQQNEMQQIYKIISQLDPEFLPKIRQILTNIVNHTKEEEIFHTIRELQEPQKKNALKLIELMRNPKGKHKNEIISIYRQKKALEYITDKHKNQVESLKVENARLKSINRKLSKTNQNLAHKVQSISRLSEVRAKRKRQLQETLQDDVEIHEIHGEEEATKT